MPKGHTLWEVEVTVPEAAPVSAPAVGRLRKPTPLAKILVPLAILLAISTVLLILRIVGLNVGPLGVWWWIEGILGVLTVGIGLGELIWRFFR